MSNKILISACVYGDDVRWNGSNRIHQHIHDWAEETAWNLYLSVQSMNFGTPRSTIRLRAVDGEVKAFAGKKEVYSELQENKRLQAVIQTLLVLLALVVHQLVVWQQVLKTTEELSRHQCIKRLTAEHRDQFYEYRKQPPEIFGKNKKYESR